MKDEADTATLDLEHDLLGMTRKPDHATSERAASKVRRLFLRETVLAFARDCEREGFIDDDLKAYWPHRPESSLRKRRTELTQEGRIALTGATRINRAGQAENVYLHRDFHPSPPPIVERDTTPKQSKIARLEARVEDLLDMVASAMPYVEEEIELRPEHYSAHGLARMNRLARRMRAAIEA